ncbi:hypothetical protein BJF81_08165 [Ornithinimicrobium sp. CNJ-824]|nr:hypothetical protein BJF81_08165 [Ornithinimicrobium sp. CNJ-824]
MVERAPVVLARQLVDVAAQGTGVLRQLPVRLVGSTPSPWARRKAPSGALLSMTRFLPPGRWTTTSGRTRTSWRVVAETCSSKSHRASIPACSSTRRSWTSPHVPLTAEDDSAPESALVCSCRARVWWATCARCSPTCP